MTPLRKKRLLILAKSPNSCHKKYYSQYCELIGEGLVFWQFGTANLTPLGIDYLECEENLKELGKYNH